MIFAQHLMALKAPVMLDSHTIITSPCMKIYDISLLMAAQLG